MRLRKTWNRVSCLSSSHQFSNSDQELSSATDSDKKDLTKIVSSIPVFPVTIGRDLNELKVSQLDSNFPVDQVLEKAFKKAAWYSLALTSAMAILGMCLVCLIPIMSSSNFLPCIKLNTHQFRFQCSFRITSLARNFLCFGSLLACVYHHFKQTTLAFDAN